MRGIELFEMFRSMEPHREAPVEQRPARSTGRGSRAAPLVDHLMARPGQLRELRALHYALAWVNEQRKARNEQPIEVAQLRGDDFGSFGEQLHAIANACKPGAVADRRLIRASASEGDPSSGGFLVGTRWATELVSFAYEDAVLAPLCDRRPTAAPLSDIRIGGIDETSRIDGSRWGGALAYWLSESSTIPATFPKFKTLAFSAKKLVVAMYLSDELMADVPAMDAHVQRVFSAELGFKLDLSILTGNGVGVPLGITNAPATIVIPAETGQASATVVAENIKKMWSRLPAPSRRRAVWLVNEDIEEQLDSMANVIGTSGAAPPSASALYVPGGVGGNPYPLLKGRPVLAMEQNPVTGQVGDIVLCDPEHYILVDGGIMPMLSVHFDFLDDQSVARFVLRCDGQPAFSSAITPYNGSSNKRSPFVVLAAR
jgi:HK97 family phage major capsid protein